MFNSEKLKMTLKKIIGSAMLIVGLTDIVGVTAGTMYYRSKSNDSSLVKEERLEYTNKSNACLFGFGIFLPYAIPFTFGGADLLDISTESDDSHL